MADHDADKSQEATPFRREEAREKGQVARSHDLASALILVVGLCLLLALGAGLVETMGRYTQRQLGGPAWLEFDIDALSSHTFDLLGSLATTVLPILGLLLVAAIAGHVFQTGLMFNPERLMPDWSHVSLIQGFRRLFSLTSAIRLGFGLLKFIAAVAVGVWCLAGEQQTLLNLAGVETPLAAKYLVDLVLWTSLKIAVALLVLAMADYMYQRWKYEQDLRMTTQEVREELKNLQGDPSIIARRRQVQRQLVQNRLKTAVPKADVVITNPTELAVAIQYVPEEMAAPIVVAKGAGVLAQQIRRLALAQSIPIVENKPLAQQLYREVDVNRPIPDKAYAAVAEVLAYVYRLKGKTLPGQAA
jgi:flagellar biosynthetic protein FlhB